MGCGTPLPVRASAGKRLNHRGTEAGPTFDATLPNRSFTEVAIGETYPADELASVPLWFHSSRARTVTVESSGEAMIAAADGP